MPGIMKHDRQQRDRARRQRARTEVRKPFRIPRPRKK